MAILTGAGNVTEAAASSATALTIDKPANAAEGDLMLAALYPRLHTAAGGYSTPPTGWSLVAQISNTTVGWIGLYAKVATASEPSTYTWSGSTNGRQAGLIMLAEGLDTANLLDTSGGYATLVGAGAPGATITATSISPTSSDALLVGLVDLNTTGGDPGTFTPPSGMTTVGDAATNTGGSDSTLYVGQEQLASSGATGTRVFTTADTSTPASGSSMLVALQTSASSTDHTATPSDALGLTDIAAAAKTTVWPVTREIQIG